MTRTQAIGLGLSVLLVAALATVIDRTVGWAELATFWRKADPWVAIPAMGFLIFSHLTRAQRLYGLLYPRFSGPRWRQVLAISTWHTALNNLLPMRSGEVSLPILIKRRLNLDWADGVTLLLVIRILDISALLLVWALSFLSNLAYMATAVVLWFALNSWMLRHLPAVLSRLPARWQPQTGVRQLAHGNQALLLTFVAWASKFTALLLLATAVLPRPAAVWASAILGGELSSVSPVHGPAGLGSYEAAFVAPAVLAGVEWSQALAIGLNLHLFLLIVSVICAALAQWLSPHHHRQVTLR